MTRFVFFSLLGSTPISTTFTSGVNPMRFLTVVAISEASYRKSTVPFVST